MKTRIVRKQLLATSALIGLLAASAVQAQCRDPWLTDAIRSVHNRVPNGGGEAGECNIKLYNNGSWGSKNELIGHVRAVNSALYKEQLKFGVFKLKNNSFDTGLLNASNRIVASGAGNISAQQASMVASGGGNMVASGGGNLIGNDVGTMSVQANSRTIMSGAKRTIVLGNSMIVIR